MSARVPVTTVELAPGVLGVPGVVGVGVLGVLLVPVKVTPESAN
jgi:hypothetical protein